jgi:hypothetical protein
MRWVLVVVAALCATGCFFELGDQILYECDPDGGCLRLEHHCAQMDRFCHPDGDFQPDGGLKTGIGPMPMP